MALLSMYSPNWLSMLKWCSFPRWPKSRYVVSIFRKAPSLTGSLHRHSKKTFENHNADIRFDGSGEDLHDDFFTTGWLNALPPQCDIPGWQRITFMKYFEDDFNTVSRDNLWAYEGVVLPGGRIILGRWWYASVSARVYYTP